jgi:tellurite resistance protein TerC
VHDARDGGVLGRPQKTVSVPTATRWSILWLVVGVALALPVGLVAGGDLTVDYLTVYLVERSLSLDNVFLFLLILSAFEVPQGLQRRLLLIGVGIALGLRALAIVVGAELLERFSFVSYVLGALLLVVALRMLRGSNEELNVEDSRSVRLLRRVLPIADEPRGGRLVVRERGRRLASPLILPLAAITVADVTFAVDSIPAAFAITRDAAAIWIANAAALLGLASLFVLVRALVERFRFMSQTLAAILVFIAARLLLEEVVHIPPTVSLAGVLLILGVGVALSLAVDGRRPPHPAERQGRRPPRCPVPPAAPRPTVG